MKIIDGRLITGPEGMKKYATNHSPPYFPYSVKPLASRTPPPPPPPQQNKLTNLLLIIIVRLEGFLAQGGTARLNSTQLTYLKIFKSKL